MSMKYDPELFLKELFEIVGLEDKSQAYASVFINLVHAEVLSLSIGRLNQQQREMFEQKLKETTDERAVLDLVKEFIPSSEYEKILREVGQRRLADYMTRMMPNLSEQQKVAIAGLEEKLGKGE